VHIVGFGVWNLSFRGREPVFTGRSQAVLEQEIPLRRTTSIAQDAGMSTTGEITGVAP
jgi:hypothetical protein